MNRVFAICASCRREIKHYETILRVRGRVEFFCTNCFEIETQEDRDKDLPPSKEALIEIRGIVERIKDGTYHHGQIMFHCGTAHCIAGWKTVLDAQTELGLPLAGQTFLGENEEPARTVKSFLLDKLGEPTFGDSTEWDYAQRMWGLTQEQASDLFSAHLGIDDIEETLRMWEAQRDKLDVSDRPSKDSLHTN